MTMFMTMPFVLVDCVRCSTSPPPPDPTLTPHPLPRSLAQIAGVAAPAGQSAGHADRRRLPSGLRNHDRMRSHDGRKSEKGS